MAENQEYTKVNMLEARLDHHAAKVEQRLDQLVTLMQAVAALQEKEARNSDAIKELKDGIKDSVSKFDSAVDRIHTRLDKIVEEQEKEKDAFFDQIRSVNKASAQVDEKVEKWVNRGLGLWSGISVIVIIVQSFGGYMLSEFKKDFEQAKSHISEIHKRQNDLENDVSRINSNIRSLNK